MGRVEDTVNDPRIKSILVNPRLVGLPYAEHFSAFMFAFIIIFNAILAIILSRSAQREENVPVNVLNTTSFDSSGTCQQFVTSKQLANIPFISNLDPLEVFSIDANIPDPDSFNLDLTFIPEPQLQELKRSCVFDGSDDCIQVLDFEIPLEADAQVNSSVAEIVRRNGDFLMELSFQGNLAYSIYHSTDFLFSPSQVSIRVTKDENLMELFVFATSTFDIKDLLLQLIDVFATPQGRDEVLIFVFSPSATLCPKQSGLSTFEYFALMADYSFVFEGFLSVGVALTMLNCCNLVATTKKGRGRTTSAFDIVRV